MIRYYSVLQNAKISYYCLSFMKWWHSLWMFFSVFSILGFLAYGYNKGDFEISKRMFLVNLSLFAKSYLYYKASSLLIEILNGNQNTRATVPKFKRLGLSFLGLFILSLVSLLNGQFYNSTSTASKMFLRVLPDGTYIHKAYEGIYLYIPAVFDFIKPHADGTALLIIAMICFTISGRRESA